MQLRNSIMIRGFLLAIVFLCLNVSAVRAQESDNTFLFYYEDENPNRLDVILLQNNICLEAILKRNPGLDINNISYGDSFYVPVDEACYEYDKSIYGYWNFSDGYPPRLKYYENGQWLRQPYYSKHVIYREPKSVEEIAREYNICPDVLLADNVLLQQFETYREYTWMSMDIFLPVNAPPCDPDWSPQKTASTTQILELPLLTATPMYFVTQYNICPEEIHELAWAEYFYQSYASIPTVRLSIPDDALPCYDENGRRLRYYDDLGNPLEKPEYSELPTYVVSPGETMQDIASLMGVCLIDLLRMNHFPDLPAVVEIELFMPPSRPCPDQPVEAYLIQNASNDLDSLSRDFNICTDLLRPLNPHLAKVDEDAYVQSRIYKSSSLSHWVLIPTNAPPCFWEFYPTDGLSVFDIERELNICYQEFRWEWIPDPNTSIPGSNTMLFIPYAAPPCYNEQGQRLQYPTDDTQKIENQTNFTNLEYSDMPIHIFQGSDTVYSLSRQYNVCVHDLLAVNPRLAEAMPIGYPTFIPKTRPCYDEAAGMPLIYEDAAGNPLSMPQISKHLTYYGSQAFGRVSAYYNVCVNRIEDANRDKLERRISYLGWIIPTDRPPCYDQDGNPIDYVCYREPVDFTVDHSGSALSFDVDGTHCYELANPETEIWYQGKLYRIISYYNHTMLDSRAFTAWCYGVSLDEINTINDKPDMLAILPFQTRAVPAPTRECYVDNPQILSGEHRYLVQKGDTLLSIAERYRQPSWLIAATNDLDATRTIWAGQFLIIPSVHTMAQFYFTLVGSGMMVVGLIALLCYTVQHRRKLVKRKISAKYSDTIPLQAIH
jgi:LysM repeat protein